MKKILFSGIRFEGLFANTIFLISRVSIGLMMAFGHGIKKIPPSEKFILHLGSLGLPFPGIMGWCAGLSEFLFAIFISLGLMTRLSSAFVIITMAVAAFVAHGSDPFAKKEMALLYLVGGLTYLALGAGRFSLDNLINKK
ncbi:MAG: DoxX family protein [Bdellovibrionales bacterium]|nr:DoxX family protein [Bdellovibrionales bacterium]